MPAKRGEVPKSNLKEPSTSMYESMSENELDKLAPYKALKTSGEKNWQKGWPKDRQKITGWNYLSAPAFGQFVAPQVFPTPSHKNGVTN